MKKKPLLFLAVAVVLLIVGIYSLYRLYSTNHKPPKLIIGIVVDQMSYDFIPRYWNKYSENGFKRLVSEGFFCKNSNHTHFPTNTAPGHTVIYTGSVPSVNGITGNDWVDNGNKMDRYCADDSTVHTVGSYSDEGKKSPASLLTNTITDQLKQANDMKSKVFGIALKDRGGIFPAGHSGNAAFWYDIASKRWITSSYYMQNLPKWVEDFNSKDLETEYFKEKWTTLLPIEKYSESLPDDNEFEDKFKGDAKPIFPYNLPELKFKNTNLIRYTPFGNSLTKEFALELLKNEKLGFGDYTDFLCLSFSSSDYCGHLFGPNSTEIQDVYLRLDRDIAAILGTIDMTLGKENVLVFLTSDHGVCSNPEYLKSQKFKAGTFYHRVVLDSVNSFLSRTYSVNNLALYFMNQQVYLDRSLIQRSELMLNDVSEAAAVYIKKNIPGVRSVFTAEEIKRGNSTEPYFEFFKNGFYESRCGDVFVNFMQYWIEDRIKGSEHGSPYEYDTHVPLVWYGWKIPKGETSEPLKIVDIAPTLAALLGISPPEGCMGKPIREIIDNLK